MSPSLDVYGGLLSMGSLTGQPTSPAPSEAISTKGLVLRRPRTSDADDIFDNDASDPEVTRFVVWRPYKDRSEVARFLQSRLARWITASVLCEMSRKNLPRALSKKWECNGRELFGAILFIRTCRPSRGTALYIPGLVENSSKPGTPPSLNARIAPQLIRRRWLKLISVIKPS